MNVIIFKVLFLACVLQTQNACSDLSTTVHIQNYEGPIYLNPKSEDCFDNQLHHDNHVKCPRNDECPCHGTHPTTVKECTSTCHSKPQNFEPDCTCVSKNRNNMVPINTSSQNSVLYGHGQYPLWCFPYNMNGNQGYGKSRYPDMFSNVVVMGGEGKGNGNVRKYHRCGCSQV